MDLSLLAESNAPFHPESLNIFYSMIKEMATAVFTVKEHVLHSTGWKTSYSVEVISPSCSTTHTAQNDLLLKPSPSALCSQHVFNVIVCLNTWMWGWSHPITSPQRNEHYLYGDIHHGSGPWEPNKGRKAWGTWRRQWLMICWDQCDRPIITQKGQNEEGLILRGWKEMSGCNRLI